MLRATKVSPKGLAMIAGFEGFVAHPYNDVAGNATIGYGHLIHLGPVRARDLATWGTITKVRALELLDEDVQAAVDCVLRNVNPPIILQNRFDAMVSFTFNLGCGPISTNTGLRACLNTRTRAGVYDHILMYDHAGGVKVPGLTRRREAEAKLWRYRIYP